VRPLLVLTSVVVFAVTAVLALFVTSVEVHTLVGLECAGLAVLTATFLPIP
jgi:hypothetical protein